MSTSPPNEHEALAAEYALGVLEGQERAEAERRLASDPAFAQAVAEWQERLAPLIDEVAAVAPPPALWDRINGRLEDEGLRPRNVHQLERRVTIWQSYSAAISAIAAALLFVIALRPGPDLPLPGPPPPSRPQLVANVAAEDRSAAFVVSYDPASESLLVSPAVASPAPGHDHELWLIPASGTPQSLGLVASTSPHRLAVTPELQRGFRSGATIAISVEPVGGSPTGQPTGPVVATGKLAAV